MGVSKWAWKESCENERCCGECDLCNHHPEDEEEKEWQTARDGSSAEDVMNK